MSRRNKVVVLEEDELEEESSKEESRDVDSDDSPIGIFGHKRLSFKRNGRKTESDEEESEEEQQVVVEEPPRRRRGPQKVPPPPVKKKRRLDHIQIDLDSDDDLENGAVAVVDAKEAKTPVQLSAEEVEREILQIGAKGSGKKGSSRKGSARKGSGGRATGNSSDKKAADAAKLRARLQQLKSDAGLGQQMLAEAETAETIVVPDTDVIMPGDEKVSVLLRRGPAECRLSIARRDVLSRVCELFAKQKGLDLGDLLFTYKGERVAPADTPDLIQYVADEPITVQTHAEAAAATSGAPPPAPERPVMELTLQYTRTKCMSVKMFTDDKFEKLFARFAKSQGVEPGDIKFLFDGQKLNPDSTPQDLDMEDDDVIDVQGLED